MLVSEVVLISFLASLGGDMGVGSKSVFISGDGSAGHSLLTDNKEKSYGSHLLSRTGLAGGGGGVVSSTKSSVKAREGVTNGGTGTGGLPSLDRTSLCRSVSRLKGGDMGGGSSAVVYSCSTYLGEGSHSGGPRGGDEVGGGGGLPIKNARISVLNLGLGDVGGGGGGNGGTSVSTIVEGVISGGGDRPKKI